MGEEGSTFFNINSHPFFFSDLRLCSLEAEFEVRSSYSNDLLKEENEGFSSVQSLSHVQLFVTPWTAACQASLSITNYLSLPKLMSIQLVMGKKSCPVRPNILGEGGK